MKPSAYMKRNTRGVLKNPPRSSFGRKVRGKAAARSPRKARATGPRLQVTTLGKPLRINYRHHKDGKHYAHDFKPGARLFYTNDGSALIITGINVQAFIEG